MVDKKIIVKNLIPPEIQGQPPPESLGTKGGRSIEGASTCVCPQCGKEIPGTRGLLCSEQRCWECGLALMPK
jgi:hypothetical protein